MNFNNSLDVFCAAEEPLLNGANPVPDSYFNASSEYGGVVLAISARMNASYWWRPDPSEEIVDAPTFYLQVSLILMMKTDVT